MTIYALNCIHVICRVNFVQPEHTIFLQLSHIFDSMTTEIIITIIQDIY